MVGIVLFSLIIIILNIGSTIDNVKNQFTETNRIIAIVINIINIIAIVSFVAGILYLNSLTK